MSDPALGLLMLGLIVVVIMMGFATAFTLMGLGMFFGFIAFCLFFTSMMAETKRAPFDLPESESELAAGYFTEYSGMKFLLFWLGEFAEITVASAVITVMFFGGWQLPYLDMASWGSIPFPGAAGRLLDIPWASLLGPLVFGAKVSFFAVLQVVIRWTLPRFRYDQVMNL